MNDQEIIGKVLNRLRESNYFGKFWYRGFVYKVLVRYARWIERAKLQKSYKKVPFEVSNE